MTAAELAALPEPELWAYLRAELGLTQAQIADGLSLPPAAQVIWLEGMSGLDFTKPGTPAWQVFLDALPIVGEILGLASGARTMAKVVGA